MVKIHSLKLTASLQPEDGWLEDEAFLFRNDSIFRGSFAVRFREGGY